MKPHNIACITDRFPFEAAADSPASGAIRDYSAHSSSRTTNKIPNERANFLSSASLPARPAFTGPAFANSGYQSLSDIASTQFALQAAHKIIDGEGQLDVAQVNSLLRKLLLDTMQGTVTLAKPHRIQLAKTLKNLLRRDVQEAIQNVCANPGDAPGGEAQDLVRATLTLPADTVVTAIHARQAVVMCLLGNLRQHAGVGSCFATSIASSLLDTQPLVVLADLKEILEKNALTVEIDKKKYVVPVNTSIHVPTADVKMTIQNDGTCVGLVGSEKRALPFKLHATPGMEAVLTVLGFASNTWEKSIQNALLATHQNAGMHHASCRDLIEHLADASVRGGSRAKKIALAVNAFSGQENVRLMRAWEYTMASCAEVENLDLAHTAVFGDELPQRPDLRSLLRCASDCEAHLATDPDLFSAPLNDIYMTLLMDVVNEISERFNPQFVANMEWEKIADDGESCFGAFKLFDKGNNTSGPVSIDNPEIFKQKFSEALHRAAENGLSVESLRRLDGSATQNAKAWNKFVTYLQTYIHGPEFVDYVCIGMNTPKNEAGPKALSACTRFPWGCFQQGGNVDALMEMYGGKIYRHEETSSIESEKLKEIIHFIGQTLTTLTPTLDPAMVKTGIFLLPASNAPHAFRLLTKPFQDIWMGKLTAEQWIEEQLIKPAMPAHGAKPKEILIADSNWSQSSGDASYLALAFNAQTKEIELCTMNEDGSDRVKRDGKWLDAWRIASPLTARALPD